MMDEGAASLRDRDMIARRRGGPFVHRASTFSLSTSRTRVLHSSSSSLLLADLAYVARAPERVPVTERSRMPMSRPLTRSRIEKPTGERILPPRQNWGSLRCDLSCNRGIFQREAKRSQIESLEIESAIRRFRCHRSSRDRSSILRLDRPKESPAVGLRAFVRSLTRSLEISLDF